LSKEHNILAHTEEKWPDLPYEEWKDTLDTLHMCMQIAGKIKLKLTPFINQWWNVAFYLTARGISTGIISYKNNVFEINFDFIEHKVIIRKSDNKSATISLYPRSVSDFYNELMNVLRKLGIEVEINKIPSEVPDPIPCDVDTRHCFYDIEYVNRWRQILLKIYFVFERFRTPFFGKSSPIQFFWGSFDLTSARFSGKPAKPPADDIIMRFAENQENFAYGFWAGNKRFPHPAFYSYIYPAPKGIGNIRIEPASAYFDKELGEFILLYDDVCNSPNPEKMIMDFLQSSYYGSVKLAGWDIKSLEGPVPDNF
jgi:hypothetical protein